MQSIKDFTEIIKDDGGYRNSLIFYPFKAFKVI